MSLVEELHAARKARLIRLGMRPAPAPEPVKVVEPEVEAIPLQKPVWFSVEDVEPPEALMIQDVIRVVCDYFHITETAIKSARRHHSVVYPRQLACFLARRYTRKSMPEIGRRIGGRDHTTILHAARKIEKRCRDDWQVAFDIAHIEALL